MHIGNKIVIYFSTRKYTYILKYHLLTVCISKEKTKCQLSISKYRRNETVDTFQLKSYIIWISKIFSAIGLSFYSFIFLWYEFITLRCYVLFFIHRNKLFLFLFFLICVMRFSGLSQVLHTSHSGLKKDLNFRPSFQPRKERMRSILQRWQF